MDANDFKHFSREFTSLLRGYLPSYRWTWSNSVRQAGVCYAGKRLIRLSAPIAALNSLEDFHLIGLHEASHGIIPNDSHGPLWRAKCLELGGDGKRTHNLTTPDAKYIGICLNGHRYGKHRAPVSGGYVCTACKPNAVIDWHVNPDWKRASELLTSLGI